MLAIFSFLEFAALVFLTIGSFSEMFFGWKSKCRTCPLILSGDQGIISGNLFSYLVKLDSKGWLPRLLQYTYTPLHLVDCLGVSTRRGS